MAARPRPGTVLRCEEGSALVVEPGTTGIDALLTLLEEEYGGDRFDEANPVVVQAASEVRIQTWRSYLKAQREDEDLDDFVYYYGPDGRGQRTILVAYFDGDTYALGDQAVDLIPVDRSAERRSTRTACTWCMNRATHRLFHGTDAVAWGCEVHRRRWLTREEM